MFSMQSVSKKKELFVFLFTYCQFDVCLTNKTKAFLSIIEHNVVPLHREHNKM